MVIGIRPTVDFAFKLLFGSPEHWPVTIHFLNAILGGVLRITRVQIENPFLGKQTEDDKFSVLDIRATDEHGRMLNIEMQTTLAAGMRQRVTYYIASLFARQLSEGQQYTDLHPAISICVLTKPLFPDVAELHLEFKLRTSSDVVLTDDLQVHLLQLSNLTVTAQNIAQASPIEQWAHFLLYAHTMTLEEVARLYPDPEFLEAAGVLDMISKTPDQREQYEARLKFQLDEAARMQLVRDERDAALRELETARDAARIEGLREGEVKGLREGEVKGRVEGRREGEARGLLFGRIVTLQQLLGLPESSLDELQCCDEAQLIQLSEQLQHQLRNRDD